MICNAKTKGKMQTLGIVQLQNLQNDDLLTKNKLYRVKNTCVYEKYMYVCVYVTIAQLDFSI